MPTAHPALHSPTVGPAPPDLLTLREVAAALRASERSVRRWVRDGRLPAYKLPGPTGRYLIPRADLDAFIEGAT